MDTNLNKVKTQVLEYAKNEIGENPRVISIDAEGENTKAIVELIHEKQYIDDILGIYEFTLDSDDNITGYKRRGLRRVTDVGVKPWDPQEVE